MGNPIFNIKDLHHNYHFSVLTEGSGLELVSVRHSNQSPGGATVRVMLGEGDAEELLKALTVWKQSRKTLFEVGDIVYVPTSNLAGKVDRIMNDRVLYGAPYHVSFVNAGTEDPPSDYFPAEELVLVARKGTL